MPLESSTSCTCQPGFSHAAESPLIILGGELIDTEKDGPFKAQHGLGLRYLNVKTSTLYSYY